MRATITKMTLVIVALGVGLACDDAPSPPPAPSIQQLAGGDIIALLPHSTVAAVELRDIAGRWDELRAIPRLSRLQDRLLEHIGLAADDVPAIAGERAVLAFVHDDATHELVPVAVFDPPSRAGALARLGRSGKLAAIEARGAVWAGPAGHARLVERVAAGDGTSLREAINLEAMNERLPGGGLVRAVIHPAALRDHLRVRAEIEASSLTGKLASFFRADLEALRSFGFRRDVIDGAIVTDGWFGIDTDVVPEEFTIALTTDRTPAALPTNLPEHVLLVTSFRTEPEASLAWLRTMAARDPDGPYRNFEFWLDEFEARSGRDVERDIVDALGARGLMLVLEGDEDRSIEFALILDTRDAEKLDATLVDLRDWLGEHLWGRSLGLAIPRSRDVHKPGGVVHGIEFRSPFGTFTGPVFQLAGDRMVLASGERGLELGVELALIADSWRTPDWASGAAGPPDEIALMRTTALGRLIAEWSGSMDGDGWMCGAIGEFLDGAGDGRIVVYWEEDGFRIDARLRVDG